MRRLLIAVTAATVIVSAAGDASAGFNVRIRGGYSRITYGDFNDYADIVNQEMAGFGELDKMQWMPEISGEVTYTLFPNFSVGAGIGYLSGKSDFGFSLGADGISYEHKLRSIPLTGTVYWEPELATLQPYLFGGLGFYGTRIEFLQSVTIGGETSSFDAELSKWGFGLHGGGGLMFSISPNVGFDVGIQARWADIKGFEGTATDSDGVTHDAYLVRDVVTDPDSGDIDYFGPWEKGEDYNEGSVDLSGFTIYIGLTVSL
jgi:hypothetical protein